MAIKILKMFETLQDDKKVCQFLAAQLLLPRVAQEVKGKLFSS